MSTVETKTPKPDFDTKAMAEEIKKFVEAKKFDLVDYSYTEIECYPPEDEKNYPETTKFASQWKQFLDDTDDALNEVEEEPGEVSFKEVLAKYNPSLLVGLEEFDKATNAVSEIVNADAEFWNKLREIVLPLYEKSPYYKEWRENRWRAISIAYDPTPLEVKTTQMWTNSRTGERIRGEELRTTSYPAGFIVKVN